MPTVKLDAKKGVVQESGENRIQINDMAIKYSSGLHGTVVPAFTSVTALAGATTLEVNTYYRVTATATRVYAMPAVANCTAGDVILVEYDADMANSTTHDYGTAGEFFSATSVARAPIASAHHRHAIDRADGTADDFLKLTGATNGGCGKATRITFTFDGTQWRADAMATPRSAGTAGGATTIAFAATSG